MATGHRERTAWAEAGVAEIVAGVLARHARRGPLVVAASGGADSTALAWIVATLRDAGRLATDRVVLAHCDHGQHARATEAAARVARLARELGCGFAFERLALPTGASEVQMRDARYASLRAIARAHGSGLVATAHHADDHVETIVMRGLRGSGRRGFGGIPLFRSLGEGVGLVRPLRDVRRATLHVLLRDAGVAWVEDPTNADVGRTRARIRHELLPALRARGPIDAALTALAAAVRADASAIEDGARASIAAQARAVGAARVELCLDAERDTATVREILRLLHVAITGAAPLGSWLDHTLALTHRQPGTRWNAGLNVERTRFGLLLFDANRRGTPPATPIPLLPDGRATPFGSTPWRLRALEAPPAVPAPCPRRERATFDAAAAPAPWRVRAPCPTDRFDPPGLRATDVPLRAILQSRGVPRADRGHLPLVVDARDRVVWAPGLDVAAFARIAPASTRAITVERVLPPGGIALPERSY